MVLLPSASQDASLSNSVPHRENWLHICARPAGWSCHSTSSRTIGKKGPERFGHSFSLLLMADCGIGAHLFRGVGRVGNRGAAGCKYGVRVGTRVALLVALRAARCALGDVTLYRKDPGPQSDFLPLT
jgi:hypothetical protein